MHLYLFFFLILHFSDIMKYLSFSIWIREFGIDMHTLLYLKWIVHKDLPYSTGGLCSILFNNLNRERMQDTQVWSLGGEDPCRRKWQPTPVFLSRESHGQRSLAGCSPWGHKESDTTEWLRTHTICKVDNQPGLTV